MKPEHDFLVFTSAGDSSNLQEWLDGKPKFDLFVSYYGEEKNRYKELTSYYMQSKGGFMSEKHWGIGRIGVNTFSVLRNLSISYLIHYMVFF